MVAKERLGRVDLETILRIGDYCNALCERYSWKTRHTAAEWILIEQAMQKARGGSCGCNTRQPITVASEVIRAY